MSTETRKALAVLPAINGGWVTNYCAPYVFEMLFKLVCSDAPEPFSYPFKPRSGWPAEYVFDFTKSNGIHSAKYDVSISALLSVHATYRRLDSRMKPETVFEKYRFIRQFDEKIDDEDRQFITWNKAQGQTVEIPKTKYGEPLWGSRGAPPWLVQAWEETKERLRADPQDFDFWINWYEQLLLGATPNWQKLRFLAEGMSETDWEAGFSSATRRLDQLQASYSLVKSIEMLENEYDFRSPDTRHGIGGNNPPEDMQIEPQIVRETTIIWAAVDELKAETEKEAPDKSAVLRIIEKLGRALRAILAFAGRMGEHAMKVAITSAVSAGTATIIAKPELLEAVIEAAKQWAGLLP